MNRLLLVVLFIAASPALGLAATAPSTSDFVSHAESGGQMEVQAGRLAADKGQTPAVKKFGERMVRDHTALSKKLTTAVSESGHKSLPKETPLDANAQSSLQTFKSATPSNFDRVYIDSMVADHKKDIANFESYARSGDDKAIREVARKALPTLKEHLAMAEEIQKKLK